MISRRQIIHGACGIVPECLDGSVVSGEYSVLSTNDEINTNFLRVLSHSRYFQQTCFHASVGVAIEKMIFKLNDWLKYPFLIPPMKEQNAILDVLRTAEREIGFHKKKQQLLESQKEGLIQLLLTGKVQTGDAICL